MSKSREQFEELAAKEGLSLEIFNGDYNWMNTRLAWKFWQASREILEIELPEGFLRARSLVLSSAFG